MSNSMKILESDLLLKVLLLGDSSTGKSSFREKLINGDLCDVLSLRPTLALDVGVETRLVGSKLVKSQIWDISGKSTSFAKIAMKGVVHLAFVFVDLQRESTFESAKSFEKMLSHSTNTNKPIVVFVGSHMNNDNNDNDNNDNNNDNNNIFEDVAVFAQRESCFYFEFNASTITHSELNSLYGNIIKTFVEEQQFQQQLQLKLKQATTILNNSNNKPIITSAATKQGLIVTLKTMLDGLTI